jgi:DNA-binding YbaB/EbfC family protein
MKGMKGMGGMPNMNKMMKQVQKMQEDMAKLQVELADRRVEATAGGGAVTVAVNGQLEVLDISISPDVVDPDDVEMLQDLVVAAVNEAIRQAQDMASREMSKITGGAGLPGGMF